MAADFLQKFTQIARTHYNAANPTATITQDVAYRAVILGLVSLITANVANVAEVTDKV
jgi:hypothetical protein